MRDEEKKLQKYKEQGAGTKKKHQVAPEPEKYHIEKEKMIGTPDMLEPDEKNKFMINSFMRTFGLSWLFTVLVLPLGVLLEVGAANVLYSEYMLGDIFNKMIREFFRPVMLWSLIIIIVMAFGSLIVMKFIYSDKKRLIIKANDALVDKGLEPVLIPRRESDRNKLISEFYKVKPPYFLCRLIPVIAAVMLVFSGFRVFEAAEAQKKATDEGRARAAAMIEKSFDGYELKTKDTIMSFVDRHEYWIGDHAKMIIDIDENGMVLDASYMIRLSASYPYKDLEKMKAKDVEKELQDIYARTKGFKELFVYPEVTEVPVVFSDYMNNYIDNIREKSEWEKDYEQKAGSHIYICHCKVSYSEGKKKDTSDDKLHVTYDVQQKNFERTRW